MNNVIQQAKGAMKTVNFIALLIALFLVWVMKDQRHISFTVLDKGCNLLPITDEQQQAYNQFPPN